MLEKDKKEIYNRIMENISKQVKGMLNESSNFSQYNMTDLVESAPIKMGIQNLLAENNSSNLYVLVDASGSMRLSVYELLIPIIQEALGNHYNAKLSPFSAELGPVIDIKRSEEEILNHISKIGGGTEIAKVLKEAAAKTKAPIMMITDSLKYENLAGIDKSIFNRTFFVVLEDYEDSARTLQKFGCPSRHITMARYSISKLKSIISNGGSLI